MEKAKKNKQEGRETYNAAEALADICVASFDGGL